MNADQISFNSSAKISRVWPFFFIALHQIATIYKNFISISNISSQLFRLSLKKEIFSFFIEKFFFVFPSKIFIVEKNFSITIKKIPIVGAKSKFFQISQND